MSQFFSPVTYKIFENHQLLEEYKGKAVPFNHQDPAHTALIHNCTAEVQKKLSKLQSLDIKITGGLSLAITATGLSLLFPLATLAAASLAYSTYHYGLRKNAYQEYNGALNNLVQCCIWTLGDMNGQDMQEQGAIKEMIDMLAPLTNANQLRDFIDDQFEENFVEQAKKVKDKLEMEGHPLNNEQRNLYYQMYGYQQGGIFAILKGIWYAIQNAFNALTSVLPTTKDKIAQETEQTIPSAA